MSWQQDAAQEVREHLWRLVRGSFITTSWAAFDDLERLNAADAVLRSKFAVLREIDRTSSLDDFVESFETVVRGLPSSIDFRTSIDSRGPYGRVRWAETIISRARSGRPELVVHSQVIRDHNRPLNRAVKSALTALIEIIDLTEGASRLFGNDETFSNFFGRDNESLDRLRTRARRLLDSPKLASARTVERVSDELWERLVERGADESLLDPKIQRALTLDPPLEDVIDMILEDLVQPSRDSDLMELMVTVRLARALEHLGLTLQPLKLHRPNQPFASLRTESGDRWEVHWRRSPWQVKSLGWHSEHSGYRATQIANGLTTSSLVPDCLVVGPDQRALVVEVKSTKDTKSPRYRDGILDAMAYLYDTAFYTAGGEGLKAIAVVQHASTAWDGTCPIALSDGEPRSLATLLQHFWADYLTTREPNEVAFA